MLPLLIVLVRKGAVVPVVCDLSLSLQKVGIESVR